MPYGSSLVITILSQQVWVGSASRSALFQAGGRVDGVAFYLDPIVGSVNRFVRGWAAYFRYGKSARRFAAIAGYMRMRLALVISKRHQRSRGYGRSVVFFRSPNHLGLIGLDGIVASPSPSGPGG